RRWGLRLELVLPRRWFVQPAGERAGEGTRGEDGARDKAIAKASLRHPSTSTRLPCRPNKSSSPPARQESLIRTDGTPACGEEPLIQLEDFPVVPAASLDMLPPANN